MSSRILSILVVVFVVIFYSSGCLGDTDDSETSGSFSGGSGGILVEFQPGAPPQQISEDDPSFDVSVKLENIGEYDIDISDAEYDEDGNLVIEYDENGILKETIQPASVFLLGVNPKTIGLCYSDTTTDTTQVCTTKLVHEDGLSGAHYVNSELIPGELTYLSWESAESSSLNYGLEINSDQSLNFVAQVCYPYRTIATAEACFSDNAYAQTTGAETCEVTGSKDVSNTIAPIQVTSVVENPAGKTDTTGKYAFTFSIQNTGGGTVFPYDTSTHKCTKLGVGDLNSNQVAIMSVKVGGEEKLECLKYDKINELYKPAEVTLVNGKGTYTCTVSQESISGDYSDLIEIQLAYNYYDQTSKKIIIKNTLDF
jgi:hypothetical protein